ncbi:MAG: hypothetical protein FD180_3544 [Planctomycetota bacterium]|nr:MAG: hypothetical protein FD180_3544 [Planctomycetota bacterium]
MNPLRFFLIFLPLAAGSALALCTAIGRGESAKVPRMPCFEERPRCVAEETPDLPRARPALPEMAQPGGGDTAACLARMRQACDSPGISVADREGLELAIRIVEGASGSR